jgi:hypothetical protein
MEVLQETSKTPARSLFTGLDTPQVAGHSSEQSPASAFESRTESANLEQRRKLELFAWILIATIWGIGALALYMIWAKTNSGI